MYSNYSDEPGFIQTQLEAVQARLQSRVGTFLQLKVALTQLKQSIDTNISSKAAALYTRQVSLEDLLTINMDKLKKLQAVGLSIAAIPDIASIANFANAMESQIKDVENLNVQSTGIPAVSSMTTFAPPMKTVALFIGALAVGFIAYKAIK